MEYQAIWEWAAIILYFGVLFLVAAISYTKQATDKDFIMGGRSMNFWMTALAAHASDMSSWLFMGYPAVIFSMGLNRAWVGIGLLVFMLLNWQLIAPRVRTATEQYNSLTFSAFFESRLCDKSGIIRIFTAVMLFVFYTIYISSALVGMGLLLNTLFGLEYHIGVLFGILIVVPYVFIGGYLTLAWIDLFQGFFLMLVVVFVPLYILPQVGGWQGIQNVMSSQGLSTALIPDFSSRTLLEIFFLLCGLGLGYFGQPHIITKFMGIKRVSDINKSKWIGMSWMLIALSAATLVGLVGIPFFAETGLANDAEVFIQMVRRSFSPFFVGLFLCAIFAVTINAMSSMVLVLSSSISEDLYKRLVNPKASSKRLLLVSRLSVILVSLISFCIAEAQLSTIYELVVYAWSGLGASFGPLLILCLYMHKITKYGAWTGLLLGGGIAAIWPLLPLPMEVPSLIPAFFISLISIWIVSKLTAPKNSLVENGE